MQHYVAKNAFIEIPQIAGENNKSVKLETDTYNVFNITSWILAKLNNWRVRKLIIANRDKQAKVSEVDTLKKCKRNMQRNKRNTGVKPNVSIEAG